MTEAAAITAGSLSGPVGRRLTARRDEVLSVLRLAGVDEAHVFGSVARGDDRPASDIDLLVDFPPGTGLFDIFRLRDELEALLGARVELVSPADLKPAARVRIESDLIAL